jgi:uncharacterized protein YndB with AHSA1/START domain
VSKASIVINAPIAKVWESLVNPEMAKQYFWGAKVSSDWTVGSTITFRGEFNGNKYEEKGEILQFQPENLLQYSHWSNLEDLPDVPENYRNWTFRLAKEGKAVNLSVTEDNIPTEKQKERSDEFWAGVLKTIKQLLEN